MLPDAAIDRTVGAVPAADTVKPPGPEAPLVTGSDMTRAISLEVVARTDPAVGAMPSDTVTLALSSRFAPSSTPPESGLV